MARELMSWPIDPQGCLKIILEDDKTYTVEYSDLYRVYWREEGFRTYKAAKREEDNTRGKV